MRWSEIVYRFTQLYPATTPEDVLRMPHYRRVALQKAASGAYAATEREQEAAHYAEQTHLRDRARFRKQQIAAQRGQG